MYIVMSSSIYIVGYDADVSSGDPVDRYKTAMYGRELSSDLLEQLQFHFQTEDISPALMAIVANIRDDDFTVKTFADGAIGYAICRFSGVLREEFCKNMFRIAYSCARVN
jgi:hypothetical protein